MQQELHGSAIKLFRPQADLGHPLGGNDCSICYAALVDIRDRGFHVIIDLKETPSINSIGIDELTAADKALHRSDRQLILINIDHLSEALRRILPEQFRVCQDLTTALTHLKPFVPA